MSCNHFIPLSRGRRVFAEPISAVFGRRQGHQIIAGPLGVIWGSVSCSRTLQHAAQLSPGEPGFEPGTFRTLADLLYPLSYSHPIITPVSISSLHGVCSGTYNLSTEWLNRCVKTFLSERQEEVCIHWGRFYLNASLQRADVWPLTAAAVQMPVD